MKFHVDASIKVFAYDHIDGFCEVFVEEHLSGSKAQGLPFGIYVVHERSALNIWRPKSLDGLVNRRDILNTLGQCGDFRR